MRKTFTLLLSAALAFATQASAAQPEKDWTFLVFLNGHNNLDSFGTKDMNEMEQVGSTAGVNVVVQWASLRFQTTKRVYVQQDNNTTQVTSPVVQELPRVDMGDPNALVEFVRWAVQNYPAKRYFINVWNHGSGWHKIRSGAVNPKDISFDDLSGNAMDTVELGQALRDSAAIIGHKIDLYGSDACLMAMAEVTDEVADSVDVFAGSEEVEPADGWPYGDVLRRWTRDSSISAAEVGKILSDEFFKSYQGGSQGRRDVTFSVLDLSKMGQINDAVRAFGGQLLGLSAADKAKVRTAANATINFTYGDYGDLMDFMGLVERSGISSIRAETYGQLRTAMQDFVIVNQVSSSYARAQGLAIWLPTSLSTYNTYSARYNALRFQTNTAWGDALRYVLSN